MIRIAVGNQIGQQIEDLCLTQRVDDAGRHIRSLRQRAETDLCFANGPHFLGCRQWSNHYHPIILALDTARDDLAGFRFDFSRRKSFGDDF